MNKTTKMMKTQTFANPFTETLTVEVVSKSTKDDDKSIYYLEYNQFFKGFYNGNYQDVLLKLSPNANKLMTWIQVKIIAGEDIININRTKYMNDSNVGSINTVRESITELCVNKIITPTHVQGIYYINPAVFFKGSRIKKYPDNIKVVK